MYRGREDAPGYFYIVRKPGDDWEVWMWTGHTWYEPGEAEKGSFAGGGEMTL